MKTMNDSVIVKAPLAGKQGRDFRPLLRMVAEPNTGFASPLV
jgi:hypothetical protein